MCVCELGFLGLCGEFLNMFVEDLSGFGSIVCWMNRRGCLCGGCGWSGEWVS
jgi:hypothetical protein